MLALYHVKKSNKKKVICLSTDKAAYPVNAMGTSKAMMEKVVVAKSRTVSPERTSICCTRYGNVLCSRGSVVPLWIEQIKNGEPITITEPQMTRFIMSSLLYSPAFRDLFAGMYL